MSQQSQASNVKGSERVDRAVFSAHAHSNFSQANQIANGIGLAGRMPGGDADVEMGKQTVRQSSNGVQPVPEAGIFSFGFNNGESHCTSNKNSAHFGSQGGLDSPRLIQTSTNNNDVVNLRPNLIASSGQSKSFYIQALKNELRQRLIKAQVALMNQANKADQDFSNEAVEATVSHLANRSDTNIMAQHESDDSDAKKSGPEALIKLNGQVQNAENIIPEALMRTQNGADVSLNENQPHLETIQDKYKIKTQESIQLRQIFIKRTIESVIYHANFQTLNLGQDSGSIDEQLYKLMNLGLPLEICQFIKKATFLCKMQGMSFMHCRWFSGSQLIQDGDPNSLRLLVSYCTELNLTEDSQTVTEGNNNVSKQTDDKTLSLLLQTCKNSQAAVIAMTQSSFLQPMMEQVVRKLKIFEPDLIQIEKVLLTNSMYPLTNVNAIKKQQGTWREYCGRILEVLLNLQIDDSMIGLNFSGFNQQVNCLFQAHKRVTTNLNSNSIFACSNHYFQWLYRQSTHIEKQRKIQELIGLESRIDNLTQLQNLLYNKCIGSPAKFWTCLGQIFKVYMLVQERQDSLIFKHCTIMRTVSYYLFRLWERTFPSQYEDFLDEVKSPDFNVRQQVSNAIKAKNLKQKKLREQNLELNNKQKDSETQKTLSKSDYTVLDCSKGSSQPASSQTKPQLTQLKDILLYQRIIHQNQNIIEIENQIDQSNDQSKTIDHLKLFEENQQLMERLLGKFKQENMDFRKYATDMQCVKNERIAEKSNTLLQLRQKLLHENSHMLKKIASRSDGSNKSQQGLLRVHLRQQAKPIKPEKNPNGDSSSESEIEPYFLFDLIPQRSAAVKPAENNSIARPIPVSGQLPQFGQPLQVGGLAPPSSNAIGQQNLQMQQQPSMTFTQSGQIEFPKAQQGIGLPLQQIQQLSKFTSNLKRQSEQLQQNLAMLHEPEQPDRSRNQVDQNIFKKLHNSINELLSKRQSQLNEAALEQSNQTQSNMGIGQQFTLNAEASMQNNQAQFGDMQRPSRDLKSRWMFTDQAKANQRHSNMIDSSNLTQVLENQAREVEHFRMERELNWLLHDKESLESILENPYIKTSEVQSMISSLFSDVEDSSMNDHEHESFSMDRMYLYPPNMLGKEQSSADEDETPQLQEKTRNVIRYEPLFLIKWKGSSHASISWEPLSVLRSSGNINCIRQFISKNHSISIKERQYFKNAYLNHNKMLSVLDKSAYTCRNQIYQELKQILDAFVYQTMLQSNLKTSMDSKKRDRRDLQYQDENLSLQKIQQRSIKSLEKAFQQNHNVILADQRGYGKRVTIAGFLQKLQQKYKQLGPFLIITSDDKLSDWELILKKFKNLRPLIFTDTNKKIGIDNLKLFCLYKFDITVKGRMTNRISIPQFDVMIISGRQLLQDFAPDLKVIPFQQVVVDQAHIETHLKASQKIICKRVIHMTSDPFHQGLYSLLRLVSSADPTQSLDVFYTPEGKLIEKIESLNQLRQIQDLVSPISIRHFQSEVQRLFGNVSLIDVEVEMTPAQAFFYRKIYEKNIELFEELSATDQLSERQKQALSAIGDMLLKCCTSFCLIDSEEKIFNYCAHVNKRDLKSIKKQQAVSSKVQMLNQIVEQAKQNTNKTLICTHFPHMLSILKKSFKEAGVACFQYQRDSSIDTVYRFNHFGSQAVFLLHLGQRWRPSEFSFFDLDLIQNIVILDQKEDSDTDLINLFAVSNVPFYIKPKIFRLITKKSFEQKMFLRKQIMTKLQKLIFSSQQTQWSSLSENESGQSGLSQLKLPFQLSTREELTSQSTILEIPYKDLDSLFKLSAEQIISQNDSLKPAVDSMSDSSSKSCSSKHIQSLLLVEQNSVHNTSSIIQDAITRSESQDKNDLMSILDMQERLLISKSDMTVDLDSMDFYKQALGSQCLMKGGSQKSCNHEFCEQLRISRILQSCSDNKQAIIQQPESLNKAAYTVKQKPNDQGNSGFDDDDFLFSEPTLINLLSFKASLKKKAVRISGTNQRIQTNSESKPVQASKNQGMVKKQTSTFRLVDSIIEIQRQLKEIADQKDAQQERENGGGQDAFQVSLSEGNRMVPPENISDGLIDAQAQRNVKSEDNANVKASEPIIQTPNAEQKSKVEIPVSEKRDVVMIDTTQINQIEQLQVQSVVNSSKKPASVTQSLPDKCLTNCNVCHLCYYILQESQDSTHPATQHHDQSHASRGLVQVPIECQGPCKSVVHADCAIRQQLTSEDQIYTQQTASNRRNNQQQPPSNAPEPQDPQPETVTNNTRSRGAGTQSQAQSHAQNVSRQFVCRNCMRQVGQCFKCKQYGPISEQNLTPELRRIITRQKSQNQRNSTQEESKTANGRHSGPQEDPRQLTVTKEEVMMCIVGSCQKSYHYSCIKDDENVELYTNNKKQQRFRCPLHYCSGCSISGNSVQILQCVACPTSYHLKCFRADRQAVKITKKFILCGKHHALGMQVREKLIRDNAGSQRQESTMGSEARIRAQNNTIYLQVNNESTNGLVIGNKMTFQQRFKQNESLQDYVSSECNEEEEGLDDKQLPLAGKKSNKSGKSKRKRSK